MKLHARPHLPLAALSVLAMSSASLHAAVIYSPGFSGTTSENSSATELNFSGNVSNSDLINGVAASGFTTSPTFPTPGAWNTANGATVPQLNDGIHGRSFAVAGNMVEGAWPNASATATYTLGLGANGLGFDITSIRSIAAWNGAGFGNQAWTLEVQPAGGGAFVNAFSVDYQPLGGAAAGASEVLLTTLDITGVQALRVTTGSVNGGANGGAFVWRELDVFGVATIPEPSSALLVGLGAIALLRRRR